MGSPLQEAAGDEVAGLLVGVGVERERRAPCSRRNSVRRVLVPKTRVFWRILSRTGW
jgi:hypothetical protein